MRESGVFLSRTSNKKTVQYAQAAVTMAGSMQEGKPMTITVDAIYEAGVLKLLTPLPEVPEHTKVRVTVEALPAPPKPTGVSSTRSTSTASR